MSELQLSFRLKPKKWETIFKSRFKIAHVRELRNQDQKRLKYMFQPVTQLSSLLHVYIVESPLEVCL